MALSFVTRQLKRAGTAGAALAMTNDPDSLVAGYATAKGAQALRGIKNMFGSSSSSSVGSNGVSGSPSRSGSMEGQPLTEETFLQFQSKLFSYMNALVGFSDKELQLVRNQDLRNRERLAEGQQQQRGVPKRGDKSKKGFGDWLKLLGLGGLGALLGLAGLDKLQKMGAVDLDEVSEDLKKLATAILGVRVAQQAGKVVRTVSKIAADAVKRVNDAKARARAGLKADAEKQLKARASKIKADLDAQEKRIRAQGKARIDNLDKDIKARAQKITADLEAKNKALDARRAKLDKSLGDFNKKVAAIELERTKAGEISDEKIRNVTKDLNKGRDEIRAKMQADIDSNRVKTVQNASGIRQMQAAQKAVADAAKAEKAAAATRAAAAAKAAAKAAEEAAKKPPPRLVGGGGGAFPSPEDASRITLDQELNKVPTAPPKLVAGGALDDFLDKNAASRFAGTYDRLGNLLGADGKPTVTKKGDANAPKAQAEIKQIAAKNQAALRASGALSGIPEEQLKAGFDAEGRAPKIKVPKMGGAPPMGGVDNVSDAVRGAGLGYGDVDSGGIKPAARKRIEGAPTRSVNPPSKLTAEQLDTIKRRIESAKRVIGKSIPFIGAALAFYDMFERAARGDLIGVVSAGAAGIASFLPVIGIPAVLADVAFQIYRDSYRDLFGVGPLQDTSPKAVKQARDKLLMNEIIKGLIAPTPLAAAKKILDMAKRGEFKGGNLQKQKVMRDLRDLLQKMGLTRDESLQLEFETRLENIDERIKRAKAEGKPTSALENQRDKILKILSGARARTGRSSAEILGGAEETSRRLAEERRKTVRNLLGIELSDAEADAAVAAREKGGSSFMSALVGKEAAVIIKSIQDYVNPQSGTLIKKNTKVNSIDAGAAEKQNAERINNKAAKEALKNKANGGTGNPDSTHNKANDVNRNSEAAN